MGSIINVSINLDKIDKSKIIKGEKGKYLNLTVAQNKDGEDQYGNTHYVYQSQNKEERMAKKDKNYLGNGKEFNFDSAPKPEKTGFERLDGEVEDDLPF